LSIGTIGFTRKSAQRFFTLLKEFGTKTLIDTRLNNSNQLAAFAKAQDLSYFLKELVGATYRHELLLAPSPEALKAYRNKQLTWTEYEDIYLELLRTRKVEDILDKSVMSDKAVLLCSEATSSRCHRRLAVEYLSKHWGPIRRIDL
jgi:uncharacterized protein (DUF488 family)